jgi:hypothetical protein
MLTVDPDARPMASTLLRHPWIGRPGLEKGDLTESKTRLKEFSAKKRLKGAVHAVKVSSGPS